MQTLTFEAQEIRVQEQNGTTWFCAVDITRILGYKNAAQAVADNVDPKHIRQISLGKKGRAPVFVSEPGLYQLVLKSRLPAAIEFQDWVSEEVLPAIRKTGQYVGEIPLAMLDELATSLPRLLALEDVNPRQRSFSIKDWATINYGSGILKKGRVIDFLGDYVYIVFEDGTVDIVTAGQVSLQD